MNILAQKLANFLLLFFFHPPPLPCAYSRSANDVSGSPHQLQEIQTSPPHPSRLPQSVHPPHKITASSKPEAQKPLPPNPQLHACPNLVIRVACLIARTRHVRRRSWHPTPHPPNLLHVCPNLVTRVACLINNPIATKVVHEKPDQ